MNNRSKEVNRNHFNRERFIQEIEEASHFWDIIVIGGGATGLGCALDAASRGFRTLLLEQSDFAKGTSSRSTKLVHGGVRYLAQGNIGLVFEALFERGLLLQNAAHLVSMQSFIIPGYQWWDKFFYGTGLKIYDWMARRLRFHKTSLLSRQAVEKLLPNVQRKGLKGGVMYYDGQFDDSRLAVNLAQTCAEQGGVLLNYMKVEGLLKDDKGKVNGVFAKGLESGRKYQLHAKVVINATGVFVDDVLQMDAPAQQPLVTFSQGVHLVLDKSFFQSDIALMIPKTADGRVLFVVPWHDHVLVGTTDTPLEDNSLEPVALQNEIKFILNTVGEYLIKKPRLEDVLSVFAGLRPLAAPDKEKGSTKEISRGHKIIKSRSGLLTITGGKWTTYRKMAEEAVEEAIKVAGLEKKPCTTATLKIHGYESQSQNGVSDHLHVYGRDARLIRELQELYPELKEKLHEEFPHRLSEVVWAVRNEMARTVEDVLARRLRVLFLDARAAIDMVPKVAEVMANELGQDEAWQKKQIREFTSLAANYLPEPYILPEKKQKRITT
jgi:glycerol-3-phosphate dehydrogenase